MIYLDDVYELNQFIYNNKGCGNVEIEFLVNGGFRFKLFAKNNRKDNTIIYSLDCDGHTDTIEVPADDDDVFITKTSKTSPSLTCYYNRAEKYHLHGQSYIAIQRSGTSARMLDPTIDTDSYWCLSNKLYIMIGYYEKIKSIQQFGSDIKIEWIGHCQSKSALIRNIKPGYVYYLDAEHCNASTTKYATSCIKPQRGVLYSTPNQITVDECNNFCNITTDCCCSPKLDDEQNIVIKMSEYRNVQFKYGPINVKGMDSIKFIKNKKMHIYTHLEIDMPCGGTIKVNLPYKDKNGQPEYFKVKSDLYDSKLTLVYNNGVNLLRRY